MTYYSPDDSHLKLRSIRFIRRMFVMRQLGTFLCFNPILSVLLEIKSGPEFYTLLFANAFAWPYIAYRTALSSRDPTEREKRNLTLDAAFGGIWVAMMAISPVPSFIIMAMLASDRYAAGGWKQLKLALGAFLFAFIPVWLLNGVPVRTAFSQQTVWFTLPLASCYMLALSAVSYNLTLSLRKKNRELELIALMDPSLKIPNRRLFERRLESEFLRTKRGESSAYLLLIDVDNFKQVNDTAGHEVGDFLLSEISGLLRNEVSDQGIPARFGGDELVIIVQDANDESILALAGRIRQKISLISLPGSPDLHCSVSIGIAPAEHAISIHDWLRKADQALYSVKRAGKNGAQLFQLT